MGFGKNAASYGNSYSVALIVKLYGIRFFAPFPFLDIFANRKGFFTLDRQIYGIRQKWGRRRVCRPVFAWNQIHWHIQSGHYFIKGLFAFNRHRSIREIWSAGGKLYHRHENNHFHSRIHGFPLSIEPALAHLSFRDFLVEHWQQVPQRIFDRQAHC